MYRELNDNEIIYMLNENDDYFEVMFEKYKPIIKKECYKYFKVANTCGYEMNDLIQIASVALLNAINNYKECKNVLFYTYAIKCINNALKTEIKSQFNNRKKILNKAISYDQILPNCDQPLVDLIKDDSIMDPVDYLVFKEKEEEYIQFICSLPFEVAISFEMKNAGFKTSEIAKFLITDNTTILKNIKYAKDRLCIN